MRVAARPSAFGEPQAPVAGRLGWRELLLAGGAASVLLYVGLDLVVSMLRDGYSYRDQTISELSAIGASTRPLWMPFGTLYALLVISAGLGVWMSASHTQRLRVVAGLIATIGLLGIAAWPLAPMHEREVLEAGGGDWRDIMHLAIGAADMVLFTSAIVIGATALGRQFRWYSLATLATMLVFGSLTAIMSPGVQDNEQTPWLGVWERIMLFSSMLWISVLSLVLLRAGGGRTLAARDIDAVSQVG